MHAEEFPRLRQAKRLEKRNDEFHSSSWDNYRLQRHATRDMMMKMDEDKLMHSKLEGKEKFIELADRTPDSTADAEYQYMQILRDDAA